MSNDALRMAAEIVDRFSGPLKEMQRQLRQVADVNKKAHKEGTEGAQKHFEGFHKLNDIVKQTTESFKGGFTPAMSSMGNAATGVGGAIGAVVAAIGALSAASGSFAGSANKLQNLSRLTGLAINDLRPLLEIGPQIGGSVDSMGQSFAGLAQHLERLKQYAPGEMALWSGKSTGEVQAFVQSLKGLSETDAFEKIIHFADRMDPQMRQRFYQMFDIDPNLASKTAAEIDNIIATARAHIKPWTEDQVKQGVEANLAIQELKAQLESFKDYVGATFVPYLNQSVDAISSYLNSSSSAVDEYFKRLGASLSGEDKQAIASGLEAIREILVEPLAPKEGDENGVVDRLFSPEGMAAGVHNFVQSNEEITKSLDKVIADIKANKFVAADWDEFLGVSSFGAALDDMAKSAAEWPLWTSLSDGAADSEADLDAFGAWLKSWTTDLIPTIDWGKMWGGLTTSINATLAELERFQKAWNSFKEWLHPSSEKDGGAGGKSPNDLLSEQMRRQKFIESMGGERDRYLPAPEPSPAPIPEPTSPWGGLRQFENYSGEDGRSGLIKASFSPSNDNALSKSASTSDAINAIAAGTRKGVYDGLWDFYQMVKAVAGKDTVAGTGITKASYEPGGGDVGAAAPGGLGDTGAPATGAPEQPGGRYGGWGKGGESGRGGSGGGVGGAMGDNVSPTSAPGSLTDLITQEAHKAVGGDPAKEKLLRQTMEGIRSGESLHKDTYDKYITPREQSYGPFQLNRSGGLGAVFERETAAERKRLGLGDLTDPRTIGLQTAWVAKYIAAGRSMAPWRGGNHPLREADPKWGNSGYVAGATPIGSSDTNGRAQTGAATAATSGRDYSGLNILPGHGATAGGDAQPGLIDVAKWSQANDKGLVGFTALNDRAHRVFGLGSGPYGAHGQGRAFDAVSRNIEASKQRLRGYLGKMGFVEGAWPGRTGDFSLEPGTGGGTGPHLHFQWNNADAAKRFATVFEEANKGSAPKELSAAMGAAKKSALSVDGHAPWHFPEPSAKPRKALVEHFGGGLHAIAKPPETPEKSAGKLHPGEYPNAPESLPHHDLLKKARSAGMVASTHAGRVHGDASLTVKLAGGLSADGGIRTRGDLFKETKLNRGAIPYASMTG